MSTFTHKVYQIVQAIPPGKVMTYQQVATLAGNSRAARAVGVAMAHNPDVSTIPCHRIVGSNGALRGYLLGLAVKRQKLIEEGITFSGSRVDLGTCLLK